MRPWELLLLRVYRPAVVSIVAQGAPEGFAWWITPVIGGCFVLLGATITLMVNYAVQKRRDDRDARARQFGLACNWVEQALEAGGEAFRWVQKQETPTLRSPIHEVSRETVGLVDRLSSVGETLDLFVPASVQSAAKEFCLQSFLLCMPTWNEHGYAAQKSDYLDARSELINQARRFGGLEVTPGHRVDLPTYSESRAEVMKAFLPGLRAHLEFRGLSPEDVQEVIGRLAGPSGGPPPDGTKGSGEFADESVD